MVTSAQARGLLGCWHLKQADPALEMTEPVEMEFKADGRLVYCIQAGDRWQVMLLSYRIEGSELVTDQASHPGEERTAFSLDGEKTLILDYGGAKAVFERGDKRGPAV